MNTLSKDEKAEIICHETIFYAESGGQISDHGYIFTDKFRAKVNNSKN